MAAKSPEAQHKAVALAARAAGQRVQVAFTLHDGTYLVWRVAVGMTKPIGFETPGRFLIEYDRITAIAPVEEVAA